MTSTAIRLAEIEALENAATPGPWELWEGCSWRRIGRLHHQGERAVMEPCVASYDNHPDLTGPNLQDDLAFIVAARTDVPWLVDELRTAQAEIERLSKLVYVPGLWRCAKCNFSLIQSNLNTADGTVTARNEPGDKCPNCDSPLWRVSERDAGNKLCDRLEEVSDERDAALARAEKAEAEVVAALMPFVAPGGGWDMQAFHDIHDDIIVWENSGQCVTAGDVRAARRIVAKFLNEPISEMHFRRTDQNCLAPLLVRAAREIEDTHEGRLSGDTYDRRATLLADIRAAGVSWDTETVEGTVVGFVEPQRNMGE